MEEARTGIVVRIPLRLPTGRPLGEPIGLQVRVVRDGKNQAPAKPRAAKNELNEMELQVLYWLSVGKRYEETAEILGVTSNAVYQYSHRVFNKLGCNTAAGAVGYALRKGLIK